MRERGVGFQESLKNSHKDRPEPIPTDKQEPRTVLEVLLSGKMSMEMNNVGHICILTRDIAGLVVGDRL